MKRVYSELDPYGEENWSGTLEKERKPMGDCECGAYEGNYLNDGRDHWGFCNKCGTKWRIGGNLFSSWHYEDERDWTQNRKYLKKFRVI